MICKKITDIQDQFDFDLNLVSSELDTFPQRMRYISTTDLTDAIQKDSFDEFWKIISTNYPVVISITDKVEMYEFGEDALVIIFYETPGAKFIIFDIQDAKKIENIIFNAESVSSYNKVDLFNN